jgi:hypothetical protein
VEEACGLLAGGRGLLILVEAVDLVVALDGDGAVPKVSVVGALLRDDLGGRIVGEAGVVVAVA